MKKYDIAHSELTNSYYIMCDGKKVAECTEQIANIRADAFDSGYDKGRADDINAIKNDMHKRLTEEMNNPYQNQSLCEGLLYIINRCDWYLNARKEQKE